METLSLRFSPINAQTLQGQRPNNLSGSHIATGPSFSARRIRQNRRRPGTRMQVVEEDSEVKQMRDMAAARKRWEALVRDGKVKVLTPREAGYAIQLSNKTLLDVRPSTERKKAWVKGSTWIPIFDVDVGLDAGALSRSITGFMMGGWWSGVPTLSYDKRFLSKVVEKFPKDIDLILACQKGLRSLAACEQLHNAGYENLFWVQGGFETAEDEDLERDGPQPFKLAGIGGLSEFLGNGIEVYSPFIEGSTSGNTLPQPCTLLSVGQSFSGTQNVSSLQKDEAWRVNVRIRGCDLDHGYLCGTMEALNVPMADTPVVTFWEGEIVDTKNYTFFTGKWGATVEDDIKHWTKFPSFPPLLTQVEGDGGKSLDLSNYPYIFMIEGQTEKVIFDHLHVGAFQHTPQCGTILGHAENIKRISNQHLHDYISAHYTSPRMVYEAITMIYPLSFKYVHGCLSVDCFKVF